MHASANSTLLALAFSSAAAGAVMIGFGIPIKEFGIGNTLICSGTTAIIGGVLLLGFASAVRQLSQQIAGLQNVRPRTQAAGGTPLSRGGVDEEAGTAALAPAHERRPTASGGAAPTAPYTTDPATLPLPFLGDDRAAAGSGWQTPASVTDFARRRRQDVSDRDQTGPASLGREPGPEAVGLRAHTAPRTERFESIWPASKSADAHSPSRADSHPHDAQRVLGGSAEISILKSGVIEGMAYTVYTDGSIEAELPQGVLRFVSIEELRSYLAEKEAGPGRPVERTVAKA